MAKHGATDLGGNGANASDPLGNYRNLHWLRPAQCSRAFPRHGRGFTGWHRPVGRLKCAVGLRRVHGLHEAQSSLADCNKYFGPNAVCQRTWRPMCHLMLRRAGISNPTKEQRTRYQAEKLGRTTGETLLAELMPYACHDKGSWPYSELSAIRNSCGVRRADAPAACCFVHETHCKWGLRSSGLLWKGRLAHLHADLRGHTMA